MLLPYHTVTLLVRVVSIVHRAKLQRSVDGDLNFFSLLRKYSL